MDITTLNKTAKSIRTEGESWKSALKRAGAILKGHEAESGIAKSDKKLTAKLSGASKKRKSKKSKTSTVRRKLMRLPSGHWIWK